MNINSAFPSNYLKASDLGGAEPLVTIDRIELEEVGREKEKKPVVYFTGKQKGVVLNKTNAKRIGEVLGTPETDEWVGGRIRLYASTTEFNGEQVECIRVKGPGKPKPAPQAKPKPKLMEAEDDQPDTVDETDVVPF